MINEIKEQDKLACLYKLVYIKKAKLKSKKKKHNKKTPQLLGNISHMAGSKLLEVI